ncbi:MAG: rhodanese-like domain-containing protein [bacterium]
MISHWIGIVVGAAIVFLIIGKVFYGGSGVNGAAVKEKIKKGAMVIDVRTPAEYASGHFRGAKNIPLQDLQGRLNELGNKSDAVVVYCASGMRSSQAVKILSSSGFTEVLNAGGLSNLQE